MNHGGMSGMGGGNTTMPPSPAGSGSTMGGGSNMVMHMTLYWGKEALILFDGWPGRDLGMYLLSLLVVFFAALLVEWLCFCSWARPRASNPATGLVQTLVYALRVGLAYLVMLALMSFNIGVLLAAVAGHEVGFFLFDSRAFKRSNHDYEQHQNGGVHC